MTFQKPAILLALILFISESCLTQPVTIPFEKLIYHSSFCFGECPQIDMEIDSNKNIFLKRQYVIIGRLNPSKADTNSATKQSGHFKGKLTQANYDSLLKILISSDPNNLQFPNSLTHDVPIVTLIIYSGGKRKYLKSTNPPQQAKRLLSYLYHLGTELKLNKISEEIEIEE